jgi:pimeloyl-ACP methyl ester carboxylesterase
MRNAGQKIIRSENLDLAVKVAGNGPLANLMPGWPGLGLSYRHQIEPLARAGYRVAGARLRGYGTSSKSADPSDDDHDSVANDMAAITRELGAKHWVAIEHDWGYPIAF